MPTYDNPNTAVVHWVTKRREACLGLACLYFRATACNFIRDYYHSWNQKNFDPVGAPADVTCCKCRETAAFLDAVQAAEGE